MPDIWSVPEYVDNLKAALEANADLLALPAPAVRVRAFWPTIELSVTDQIILGYAGRGTFDPEALGRLRFDEVAEVDAQIQIMRAGAGDADAKVVRDRGKAVFDVVFDQVRNGITDPAAGQIIQARVTDYEFAEFGDEGGDPKIALRVFIQEFRIVYAARTG